jgi:hypothetical protein
MVNLFNIPLPQGATIYEYGYAADTGQGRNQIWTKPKGCSLIQFICLGAGGGGGNGFTATTGNNRGGGGGGGAGVLARATYPASILPDTLYVVTGIGGTSAVAGGASAVALTNTGTENRLCIAFGGGAGGTGTGAAAGAAGAAGTASVSSDMPLSGHAMASFGASVAGGLGGVHTGAVGASVTQLAAGPFTGGAGGAGCGADNLSYAGGNVTAATDAINQNITVLGGAAGSNPGENGYFTIKPLVFAGGAGGGSVNGVGGAGGNGALGCGGGGGGAGTTGGAGGRGGNGYVAIIAW